MDRTLCCGQELRAFACHIRTDQQFVPRLPPTSGSNHSMREKPMTKLSLSIPIITLALAISAQAQITTGALSGSVTDPSGQVVPRASVKLSNELTGEERTTQTNDFGDFGFPALVAGTYTVRIEASGFKPLERRGNVLLAQGRLALTLQLEVGSVSESITVMAQGALVQSTV